MGTRLQPFDVSDVDASIARERDLLGEARRAQTLRSRAFAQGYQAAADDPEGAQIWRGLFDEKAGGRVD